MASYHGLSYQSLKTFEGDPFFMSCIRNSQKIRCEIDFFEIDKGASDEYRIDIEAPPLLIFTNPTMTEHYVVDISQRAAALVSRVIRPKFAAAKTCNGTYVTESEKKANQKK
jgi:hypothetical protein